jgi:hypothetical protein
MEHPWKYYEKSVGMWVIESGRGVNSFPLNTRGLDVEGVAREYFHYFDKAMRALEGFFTITAVEYPPGEMVMAGPIPLDLYQAKQKLLEAWKKDISCAHWVPGAVYRGLTDVAVRVEDKIVSAGLPDVIAVMFSGSPGSDRYALALATNCDIWLEKAISGADNPVGRVNALKLKDALQKLEDAIDGRVVHCATEFEGVKVNEHGFG